VLVAFCENVPKIACFFAIGRSKFIFFMEQILKSIIVFVLERREYIAISDRSKQSRSGNDTGTTVDGWLTVALAGISSAADASPSKVQTVTKRQPNPARPVAQRRLPPTPLTPVLRRLWERRKGSDEWSSPRQGGRSLLPPMAFMASDARGTCGPLLGGVA